MTDLMEDKRIGRNWFHPRDYTGDPKYCNVVDCDGLCLGNHYDDEGNLVDEDTYRLLYGKEIT